MCTVAGVARIAQSVREGPARHKLPNTIICAALAIISIDACSLGATALCVGIFVQGTNDKPAKTEREGVNTVLDFLQMLTDEISARDYIERIR